MSFAIAGMVLLGSLATVMLTTHQLGGASTGTQVEATNLNAQAEGLLRLMLESPGYVGPDAWAPGGAQNADDLTRLGLLTPGSGLLNLSKFENLRLAPYASSPDGYVNYEDARTALGLTAQGLDFHIRAYPSLADVRAKLASNLKDMSMRITYVGHVTGAIEDTGAAPTLGALTCKKSDFAPNAYEYQVPINGLNQYTHLSVSLGIRQGGTGPSVEAADVTRVIPSNDYDAVARVTVANFGNVGCDATTEVQVAVSDPSVTLVSTTMTPTLSGVAPAAAPRDFRLSASTSAIKEGNQVTLSYFGAAKDDTVQWAVYDALTGDTITLSGIQRASPITVPNQNQERWFSFTAPATASTELLRVEATHLPTSGSSQKAVRFIAVHDAGITVVPFTGAGGATTASDAMLAETRWIHDLSGRFCGRGNDNGAILMDTASEPGPEADVLAAINSQCTTRVDTGFGIYPALNTVNRQGDVYYDTKASASQICRLLLVGQGEGECKWQTALPTLDYTNVLVIGSEAAHNNLVDNNFKKSVAKWVDGGGTLIVFGSSDSRQWMQSGLGIGHASSSGGVSAPDATHPVLTRPNALDWENYDDLEDQWNVDSGDFTTVTEQGGFPVTAVSDPGAYGRGNVFLTTWQPHNIYGSGITPSEGRALLDNMLALSYRDLYLDYGPELPQNAPAVPALGRGLILHDKLGLVEMDFVMYVFRGGA